MERSSWVLFHGKPKNLIFFLQKSSKFEFWFLTKSWNHLSFEITWNHLSSKLSQYQSYISNWYINEMVFTSTTPWKPKNVKIFKKFEIDEIKILSVPRVSVCRETKSPCFCQYQSYISNWYINGKVFTSTTTWEPRNLIFFFKKSSKLNSTFILTCAEELKSFK